MNFAINGIDLLKFEGFNTIYPNIQISGIIIVLGIWLSNNKKIFNYTGSPRVKILQKVLGGYFFWHTIHCVTQNSVTQFYTVAHYLKPTWPSNAQTCSCSARKYLTSLLPINFKSLRSSCCSEMLPLCLRWRTRLCVVINIEVCSRYFPLRRQEWLQEYAECY